MKGLGHVSFSSYVFVHSLHQYLLSVCKYVLGYIGKQAWHSQSSGDSISWHRNITFSFPVLSTCITRAKGNKTSKEYFLPMQVFISFFSDNQNHDWRPEN